MTLSDKDIMMGRRKKRNAKDPIQSLKIATAKARLAKVEAERPPSPQTEYTRYEDLPPLHPEERDALKEELIELLTVNEAHRKKEKHNWYMSMAHWAP